MCGVLGFGVLALLLCNSGYEAKSGLHALEGAELDRKEVQFDMGKLNFIVEAPKCNVGKHDAA